MDKPKRKKKWKSMSGAEKEAYKKWLKEQAALERRMWKEHYETFKIDVDKYE